jgi:hypothetical protein
MPSPPLVINEAVPLEWCPQVFALLAANAQAYLQTDEVLDLPWVSHLLSEEPLWTLHAGAIDPATLVGVVWWQDCHPGQSAQMHLVVQPAFVRAFYRQGMGQQLLQHVNSRWQLTHVLACFEPHREQPPKWLAAHGFVPCLPPQSLPNSAGSPSTPMKKTLMTAYAEGQCCWCYTF